MRDEDEDDADEQQQQMDGPLAGMCDLVEFLIDEGVLQIVEAAMQLKPYCKKSADVALAELVTGFKESVTEQLQSYKELDGEVEDLITHTRGLMETLIDLKGDSAMKFDVMSPFLSLVTKEFEQQQLKFGQVRQNQRDAATLGSPGDNFLR